MTVDKVIAKIAKLSFLAHPVYTNNVIRLMGYGLFAMNRTWFEVFLWVSYVDSALFKEAEIYVCKTYTLEHNVMLKESENIATYIFSLIIQMY